MNTAQVKPSITSQKYSKELNLSATSASAGVKVARQITPNSVPMKAPEVAMPMARPASPRCASAKPAVPDSMWTSPCWAC